MEEYREQLPAPGAAGLPALKPAIEAYPFTRRDRVFVILSFVICFAFCQLILFGGLGISVPVFFAAFYAFAGVWLGRGRVRAMLSLKVVLTFLPVIALLICFALYDNAPLKLLNVPALWLAVMLNLSAMAGLNGRPVFWAGTLYDILKETFYMPFRYLGRCLAGFAGSLKSSGLKRAGVILLTILVVSPLALIVLALLASSDAGFERLLNTLAGLFTSQFWDYLFKTVLSVLLTFPLFNLLYALKNGERPEKHPMDGCMLRLGRLSPLVTATSLGLFDFIYAVYIVLQADYLFSAMRGVLPEAFTFAEYARRGFFELVAVAAINFCLIALAAAVARRKDGRIAAGCRIPAALLAAETLLLIATAASKMAMYVGSYGLTPLRVYTSWFMLLIGVVTVFLLIKLLLPRFRFYTFSAVGAAVLFLALNFCNTDALIARNNIDLYRQTGKLDVSIFFQLSDSAVPEAAKLADDPQYGAQIREYLSGRRAWLVNGSWQDLTLAKEQALQAAEGVLDKAGGS